MPLFNYKGYRTDGTEAAGIIEATGLNDAIARIRAEGIFPRNISEPQIAGKKKLFQRTNENFLPNLTRQLSILLSSGVSMMDAFDSLAAEQTGFYREMLIAIKERISAGAGLYRALEDFRDVFPEFYINMVQAGEAGGNMAGVLLRLADFLEKHYAVKAKVRSAMIYPILMMAVSVVVLSFLFVFVIPKIVKIFNDTKSALPFMTTVLIFVSNVFVNYWWILVGGAAVGYIYIRKLIKNHLLYVHGFLLKIPGNIIQSLYYARFAGTLSFLLEGGLPMLKALNLSAKAMGNIRLEASVLEASEKVAGGQRLSASLEGFPPVFIQLVSTGETSGRLPETLSRAAVSYEEEFNRKVNSAVALFEPGMILVMGLVVGFIVLAVLLPMFQLNQLVK